MKKGSEEKRRRIRRRKRIRRLRRSLFCIFVAVFLVSGYKVYNYSQENAKANAAYDGLRVVAQRDTIAKTEEEIQNREIAVAGSDANGQEQTSLDLDNPVTGNNDISQRKACSMDFTALRELNPGIVGWIKAEGAGIDYPVMRADNNDYYLTHLYDGTKNSSGSIFMDYRNNPSLEDRNLVIYGHHMKNGTMFAALEEYKAQDFYEVNPYMTLYTPDGDYRIELICGTIEDGNRGFMQFDFPDDQALISYVEGFRSRSMFTSEVQLQPGDRIISLCTCSYEWANARFMLIGRLVPVFE